MAKQHQAVRRQLEEDVEKLQSALQEVCEYAATIQCTYLQLESLKKLYFRNTRL